MQTNTSTSMALSVDQSDYQFKPTWWQLGLSIIAIFVVPLSLAFVLI